MSSAAIGRRHGVKEWSDERRCRSLMAKRQVRFWQLFRIQTNWSFSQFGDIAIMTKTPNG